MLSTFIDLFLHLDKHLGDIIATYGAQTYGILFAILFAETGLVVTPFLPGDSLLFAAGTFVGMGKLDGMWLFGLLLVAVFLGDNVNYWIGRKVGPAVFSQEKSRFFDRKHLERTNRFFDKYGTRTIIFARFVPIVRTFTPFVAGIGAMPYPKFLSMSVAGCTLWLTICLSAGYQFGQMEIVKKNFSLVVLAIIFISALPAIIEIIKARREEGGAA